MRPFLGVIAIAVLGAVVYANSINGEFLWDDTHLIAENSRIKGGASLADAFTKDMRGVSAGRSYFYRPIQTLTFMLDHSLYALDSKGYHVTNILLHIAAALLVYYLVNTLFNNAALSFLTGAFFAVHPIHTEAVAYISGRADPLAAVFMLLCMLCYITHLHKEKAAPYFVIPLTYSLALLSRESSLALPLLLLIYHYVFGRKIDIKKFSLVAAISILYIALRFALLRGLLPHTDCPNTVFERLPGFFAAVANYIRLLILPFNLHMEYGNGLFRIAGPNAILGALILVGLLFFAFMKRTDRKVFSFSVLWFFAALLPSSNIYPINAYMAEHWLYLPSLGFFLILSKIVTKSGRYAIGPAVILIILFGYLTVRQNTYWADGQRLYERTLELAPGSSTASNNLAIIYGKKGDMDNAERLLLKAIESDPRNAGAFTNLGVVYRRRGMAGKAVDMYKKALEISPGSIKAHYNMGNAYYSMKMYPEAMESYENVMDIDPGYMSARENFAAAREALKKE
jgi:tetratricopeptide (TPR) repeat protein